MNDPSPVSDDPLEDELGLADVLPGDPASRPGPRLLLGPVLRYADETCATVWVETSEPAELTVLGRSTRTFSVEGHHYGYLVVDGLEPGTDTTYDVLLDGRRVWPLPDDPRPAPRLRTHGGGGLDLVFGSCRVDRPHERPWNLEPEQHPSGVGIDALQALARSCQRGERALPDLVLMLGDQVYADEGLSPKVRAKQSEKRPADSEPRGEVADFEEYTWLYLDSWSNPDVRWLLSTVPSAMVFDDHDVRDDWNISRDWRHAVQQLPWWHERIVGAYMTYWLYQHLGNVHPDEDEARGLLARVRADGGQSLRRFAEHADDQVDGRKLSRWSYCRELGDIRLVVVDSRSGRLVEDLERWNEQVCAGVWGPRAARWGERLRQALDLEHWASFSASFDRLTTRLRDIAHGRYGAAPDTVVVLSGDVHHSYVAPVRFPQDPLPPATRVVQVVSSPMRNAFPRRMQRAFGFAATPVARGVGRALARAARLPRPVVEWKTEQGPLFGNALGALRLDGGTAELTLSRAVAHDDEPSLEQVRQLRLQA